MNQVTESGAHSIIGCQSNCSAFFVRRKALAFDGDLGCLGYLVTLESSLCTPLGLLSSELLSC
jgi:hypothetical protein